MKILIMRHGEATMHASSDKLRQLTETGVDQAGTMALWLSGQDITVDHVLVSPYLRAQQTLAAVGEIINLPHAQETLSALAPNGDTLQVLHHLIELQN